MALEPELDKVSGEYFADCKREEIAPQGKDETMAAFLWKVSEKWCKMESK